MEYTESSRDATLNGNPFTVRSLTPLFANAEEQKEAKKKIERELYGIFLKYMS